MAHTLILTPAYGRTYATVEEATKAWQEGKDFKIINGPYCSIRDLPTTKRLHTHVLIRYGTARMMEL